MVKYFKETGRQIFIEYILLNKINDDQVAAQNLINFIQDVAPRLKYHLNLISYNSTGKYQPSSRLRTEQFKTWLNQGEIKYSERFRFGQDINAACGQLLVKGS